MCYRDQTFCPEWIHERCKDAKDCERTLTKQVQAEAVEWWGSDEAPICVFSEEPLCLKEKEDE